MGEQCPVCEGRSDLQDLAAGPLAHNELTAPWGACEFFTSWAYGVGSALMLTL